MLDLKLIDSIVTNKIPKVRNDLTDKKVAPFPVVFHLPLRKSALNRTISILQFPRNRVRFFHKPLLV